MSKYPGRIVTDLAPAGYSVFFTGTSYLTVPAGSAFAPGTGNFTIEAWVYPTSSGDRFIWTQTVSGTNYFVFQITTTTAGITMTASGGGTFISGPANSLVQNAWNHVAAVRSSGTVTVYVNGVGGTPTSNTLDLSNTTYTPTIGTYTHGTTTNVFAGFMSNLRYVKGTALYTANFTPPTQLFNVTNTSFLSFNSPSIIDQGTANSGSGFPITVSGLSTVSTFTPFTAYVPYNPASGAATPGVWTVDEAMQAAATRQWNMYDPNFQNTTLLLHGNPTNGTSFITDASTNNFTITPFGDVRAANLSPFSLTTFATSGSGYFDGSGDYLQTPSNAALGLSTGDFTVECWYYQTSRALTNTIIAPSTDNLNIYINTSGILGFYDGVARNSTTTVPLNTWSHIALVRSGSTATLYYNGTAVVSQANTTNYATASWFIGRNPSGTDQCTGYCSNVRIVKGTAVYTGAFTPPTAPLTAITNTSLLTLQNSQSANNNSFLDSSANNFLITRNGNTTQGSFSPYSQTGWGNNFNADGGLTVPDQAAFQVGSGNFTVEGWVYRNSNTDSQAFFWQGAGGTNYRFRYGIAWRSASGWIYSLSSDGFGGNVANEVSMGGDPGIGKWIHLALVRNGNVFTPYLNGVAGVSTTSSATLTGGTSDPFSIGLAYVGGVASPLLGAISNFRLVKGVAVYTSNFTPPIGPIASSGAASAAAYPSTVGVNTSFAASSTSILTCQNNRFVDNSNNNFSFTIYGTPSVQAFGPFYPTVAYTPQTIGGGGSFDGTGDNLTVAGNAAFAFGTGDFTLEAWIYPNSISTGTFDRVCATSDFNGSGFDWTLNTGSSSLFLASSSYGFSINTRSWNHIVYTRSGTTLRGFLNGRLAVYNASASQNITSTTSLLVGQGYSGTNFNGFMTDLRIIKGSIPTSYQTSATTTGTQVFTPPTAPLTTTSQGATSGNVSLLLNYTNAGVVDSTGKNALETVGDARISTAVSRFGGSSIAFDGTGDYAYAISSVSNSALGSGDWTVEFWLYTNVGGTTYNVIDWRPNATVGNYFALYLNAGVPTYYVNGADRIVGGSAIPATTWTHVAVSRSGTSTRMFINGTQSGSTYTDSANYLGAVNRPAIGGGGSDTGNTLNGYMDDIRVTRFARYTANFTPQTSQWQDQ